MCSLPAVQQGEKFLCGIGIMKFHWGHAAEPLTVSDIVVELDVVLVCANNLVSELINYIMVDIS